METRLYSYLLRHVIPHIRFTMGHGGIGGRKYHKMYAVLQPGDIVLSKDNKKLTGMLIPGIWSHAAVCVSKNRNFEIAEMVASGYKQTTFVDFCAEATRVCIIRAKKFDKYYTRVFIDNTLSYKGTPYDQQFKLGVGALSCSELVYMADTEKRLGCSLEDVAGLGRPYISPTGIYFAQVEAISDSDAIHGIIVG
jgi:hypothetical protein